MSASAVTENEEGFWKGLDPDVTSALSEDQKTAISQAVGNREAKGPPIDIRLSFGTFFLVLMVGRERRSKKRLENDRRSRPVFTVTNLPAIICIWIALVYMTLTILSGITWVVFKALG